MSQNRFRLPAAAAWMGAAVCALALVGAAPAAITPGQIAYVAGAGGALHIYVQDPSGGAAVPLVTGFDQDLSPAWSPDGQQIAFMGFANGQADIYVSDGSGTAPTDLTVDAAADAAPAWSPDGTQIAFAKAVVPCCPQQSQIYVMNSDGSNAHLLVSTSTDDSGPLWSPDGSKIGFTARNISGQVVGHPVFNVDGSAPSPPVTFLDAGWAPAGTRYVSSPNAENILLREVGGPSQTIFPDDPDLSSSATFGPSFSPDCSEIAFVADSVSNGTVTTDAYVMNTDGSQTRRLTNDGAVGTIAWQPLPGTGCPPAGTGNTPAGSNVAINPVDTTTGTSPVAMTFKNVTVAGNTSLTTSATGPTPPTGFQLGDPPTYYELTTTATFSSVVLCFSYAGISFPGTPQLFHFEGGAWVDVTQSVNEISQVVCATVTSLSPFALFVAADTTPPVLKLPDDITANATSPAGAVVAYDVNATDNADPHPSVNCDPASGSTFPINAVGASTAVDCDAEDASHNSSSGSFHVHVKGAGEQLGDLLLGILNDSKLSTLAKAALAAKIQSFVASFDPANPVQKALVCKGLSALIVVARALVGHGLTAERAAQIVTDAERIRAVLAC